MHRFLVYLFRYVKWLSLDIALGGAILLLYVSKELFHLKVPMVLVVLLVLAILIIYTIDHLMDARRVSHPTMARHLFHQRNQKALYFYLSALTVLGILCLFWVDIDVIVAGFVLAGFSSLYLFTNELLANKGTKELVVALVYASAMFVYPFVKSAVEFLDLIFWLQIFLLAVVNLFVISTYEHVSDARDCTTSVAHLMGVQTTQRVCYLLVISNITLSIFLLSSELGGSLPMFVLLSNVVFLLVLYFPSYFVENEKYRFACDAVFLLPVIYL